MNNYHHNILIFNISTLMDEIHYCNATQSESTNDFKLFKLITMYSLIILELCKEEDEDTIVKWKDFTCNFITNKLCCSQKYTKLLAKDLRTVEKFAN